VVRRRHPVDALRVVAGVAEVATYRDRDDIKDHPDRPDRTDRRIVRARLAGVLAVVVVVLGAAACGGGSSVGSGRPTIEFTITDEGCNPDQLTAAPGSTNFHVKNAGANNITEFEVLDSGQKIVGEKENLTPGLDGSFTVDLKAGTYTLACPGGTAHATGTLTVASTGASASGSATGDHAESGSGACVPTASASGAAATINAGLSDFKIELDRTTVAAGPVQLAGKNLGKYPHEIVVVKGVASSALPTEADGSVDEDKLPDGAKVGELEAFGPGTACGAGFDLTAGTYTLFCNVKGTSEGSHFKNGMVTTLTVS
jgi:uncharacterized cupredoxin-like copper-binding protein